MKFSCNTADLLSSVQLVGRAVGTEQALPILQNILIQVEKNRCTLSATNLELSIVTSLEVEVESEGSVTLPAKALLNFVQYNQDSTILLELSEGTKLKLQSKRAKAVISGEESSAYPIITPIQAGTTLTLQSLPLLKALTLVTFACARNTSRPTISGVHMTVHNNTLTLVGTDSYRLSEYSMPLTGQKEDISCIIPARFLDELKIIMAALEAKMESKGTATVTLTMSSQQIEASVGPVRLMSRLIEGKFPDYKQVLPKECVTTVHLSIHDLLSAIKRMNYFAKELNHNITFTVKQDVMHLTTKQTQAGKDESTIVVRIDGTENKIALSSHYLIDFLSRVDSPDIRIELIDKLHPAIFRLPGVENFLHLIMPLRLVDE